MKKRINNTIYNLHNHLDEIAVQDVMKGFKAPSKVENSGFQLLPSTSAFSLFLSQINPLLASIGIVRRLPNRVSSLPHTNKGMNRYATFTIRRLNTYKEVNPEVYWRVVESLIQKSVTFRTMAFHKTHRNGYKELPLSFVKNIVKKVNKIIDELQTDVDFKRTYIPKKEEDVKRITEYLKQGITDIKMMKDVTFRPLGIPTHAGRVVLSMHANFISLFMEKRMSKNQHAYLTGRGTGTAGESILNRIHKYDYIYEIDLKQCFPNIQAEGVTRELAKYGVPLDYCVLLEAFNRSTPRTGEEQEKRDANELFGKKIDAYLASLTKEEFEKINGDDTKTIINKIKGLEITTPKVRTRGMPQGANTSPILTEIVLDHWIKAMERVNNGTSVFYADDGIFFSNEPIVLVSDEQRGIEIHEGKSGPIKEGGVGLKEFKFCSIIYNPGRNTIRSSTRKGAELEMDTSHGIFEMVKSLKPTYSWDGGSLFRFTNLSGLIMDRLYSGNGEKPQYPIHVTIEGVAKSGMKKMGILDNFSTTSSDAVSFLANGIKGDGSLVRDPPIASSCHEPKEPIQGQIVIKGKNKVPKGVVIKKITNR